MRHYNFYIYSAFSCKSQRRYHLIINNQIRRSYINVFFSFIYYIKIYKLSNIFIIRRAVAVGHNISLRSRKALKIRLIFLIVIKLLAFPLPHLNKHNGKAPRSLSPNHNRSILPVTEPFLFIYIFVSKINAAVKSGYAVYYKNFSMIAVILGSR